jgi:uncharacterized protein (DUF58 family)
MVLDTARLWADAAALADRHSHWPRQIKTALATIGYHPRGQAGTGADFWQYRPLAAGEPASAVDWRKSARGDSLLVRDHERDVPTRLYIWCDQSASMHYRSVKTSPSKAEWAYVFAAALAQVALAAGEQVATLNAPTGARGQTEVRLRLAENHSLPDMPNAPVRSLIVVVSDCLGLAVQLSNLATRSLASQSCLIVVQVHDPAEATFPFTGRVEFQGFEAEPSIEVDDAAAARDDYLTAWKNFQQHINDSLQISENIYVSYSTSMSVGDALPDLLTRLRPL